VVVVVGSSGGGGGSSSSSSSRNTFLHFYFTFYSHFRHLSVLYEEYRTTSFLFALQKPSSVIIFIQQKVFDSILVGEDDKPVHSETIPAKDIAVFLLSISSIAP